jgi:ketosteroid isomerase-like protein
MRTIAALFLLTLSAAAQMTSDALLKFDKQFAQATDRERLEGWMKYMMEPTVIFGTQHTDQRIVGKEEIRGYYRDLFSIPDFRMTWMPTTARILASGMTGYTEGTFHWVIPNTQCKCVNDWRGTYVAIWEEEDHAGGNWKLKALSPSVDDSSRSCGCAY